MFKYVLIATIVCYLAENVSGHGMMLDPTGRASRWRYNESAPTNYQDNELFCGGFTTQWQINGGKCGLCGDDYRNKAPRAHELGGDFGEGVIVAKYKSGGTLPVAINITANHKGYFYYQICNIDQNKKESDECFEKNPMKLVTGEDTYKLTRYDRDWYNTTLKIPSNLKCSHCVLRWTYRAGNNWGNCDDGSFDIGCGQQEHFRSCADIQIV